MPDKATFRIVHRPLEGVGGMSLLDIRQRTDLSYTQ